MLLKRTAAPSADPVSVEQAKAWLRVTGDAEIDTIAGLIRTAVDLLDGPDGMLNPPRCLQEQTWQLVLDGFPSDPADILLPMVPVSAIASITYRDADDAAQIVSASDYDLAGDSWSALIRLAAEATWPATRSGAESVTVTFKAGYATADAVPTALRQEILGLVGFWFNNREKVGQLPDSWTSRYRRPVFA